MFVTIPLIASVVRDESELAAKPFYIDQLNMRSVDGKMETRYGQELACSSALTGIARGGMAWADLNRTAWAAFGTNLRLEVIDQDGTLYGLTPVIERGALSSAFTVSSGSTLITVTDADHGLVADQLVTFPGTSSAANVTITGDYVVSTVPSSSAYGFEASTANQSTAGVGPAIIDYEYHLKPGNESNLGGLGYGTGGYGSGGYGSPGSDQDLNARTWSFAPWGQNLIANPNWGAIYEWAPNVSANELVTGGDFTSTSVWTFGSGWSLGSGTASASANTGSLSQTVELSRSAWHLLDFDVTRNTGTVSALIAGSTVISASTSQTVKHAFFSPVATSQTLAFKNDGAFNGRIDNVSLKVITTAELLDGAPSSAGSIFVTAERNLVACGTVNVNTGILDPMHVRWSGSEDNQDWIPSPDNVAGGYTLSHGSRIVRGVAANRENLIFTDTACYRMRSVPYPSVVYAFDLLGEGCGLIGPNAVATINGAVFWCSPQGHFYQYAGGLPTPLENPSGRDFRDHLADVQGSKIYAAHLAALSEVSWFYPDERDGIECSRVQTYTYMKATWVSGEYVRTTYIDAGVFPFPLSADPDGNITFEEKDFSNDGSARSTMLETSYFNVGAGSGNNFATVMGVRPDFDDLQGGVKVTFYSKLYPQDASPRTYGPYNITAATKRISVRIKGRQIKYKIETDDAPTFYRVGDMTFDVNESGQKK